MQRIWSIHLRFKIKMLVKIGTQMSLRLIECSLVDSKLVEYESIESFLSLLRFNIVTKTLDSFKT